MKCERCGTETRAYELFDFCAICSKNLCDKCVKRGCCENIPAKSGEKLEEEESDG